MELHNSSHIYVRPSSGLLDAEALLALLNNIGNTQLHPVSAADLVQMSHGSTQGMLDLAFANAANPAVTSDEAQQQFLAYTLYGPYTAYEAQPMQPLTLPEAEAAVQIVGTTVGWHFWG